MVKHASNFIVGQAQQVVLKHKEHMKILTTRAHGQGSTKDNSGSQENKLLL
jgi:hypothetical protein